MRQSYYADGVFCVSRLHKFPHVEVARQVAGPHIVAVWLSELFLPSGVLGWRLCVSILLMVVLLDLFF